jgi:hypothetical protein
MNDLMMALAKFIIGLNLSLLLNPSRTAIISFPMPVVLTSEEEKNATD